MDFTEYTVLAQRADLNQQLRDASRGAEVNELLRQHRAEARAARRQHLHSGLAKLGDVMRRLHRFEVPGVHARVR